MADERIVLEQRPGAAGGLDSGILKDARSRRCGLHEGGRLPAWLVTGLLAPTLLLQSRAIG